MLELLNKTPFQFAPLAGRLNFPGHSLTFIVKGTFDLREGQMVEIAEEQLYPGADEFYPGDDEMQGGPRYEMDFAYLIQINTDWLRSTNNENSSPTPSLGKRRG